MNTRKSKQIDAMDMLSPNNTHLASNISSTTHVYPYFSSPNLNSSENGLLNGLNDIDMSANGLRSEANKIPTIVINKSNNSHCAMNSSDLISGQYIKKVIIEHNQHREDELKRKESYLNQLKSIDITKFSYPNENKPPTDYTYAKTSSYLEGATDNCEMPNLRRRSRISPHKSMNASSSRTFTQPSPSGNELSNHLNTLTDRTKQRQGYYNRIKGWLIGAKLPAPALIPQVGAASTATKENFVFAKPSVPNSNKLQFRLNRNIGSEFEDHTEQDNIQTYSSQQNHYQNQLHQNQPIVKKSRCNILIWLFFLGIALTPAIFFISERIDNNKSLTLDYNLAEDFYSFVKEDMAEPCYKFSLETSEALTNKTMNIWFEYYPVATENWANLLNYANESSILALNSSSEFIKSAVDLLSNWTQQVNSYVFSFIKLNSSKPKEKNVEFKLSNNANLEQSQEILQNMNEIKEKIYSYKDSHKRVDFELMQKELDEKFNYTLNLVSNKLVDQAMQFEHSKSAHEKEMKKIQTILEEMESRYTFKIDQLLEQLTNQQQYIDEQQQERLKSENQLDNQPVKNSLKVSYENENVTFEKIEELINRTFYKYNADKTGMTDFASESVGGSILYTKCTETYQDNSRWLTVFDVPISRLSVSPRVIIQGSIQPGNCWSFKGSKGDIFIKLAAKITPQSFSLEHIPKELSLTGTIDSAPQNFTVYGYENKDEISEDSRILLGNYRYDNNSKNTLQFFTVQYECPNKAIAAIELKIESNAGNKDYTCIYKFRVHGKLFQKNQITNQNDMPDLN